MRKFIVTAIAAATALSLTTGIASANTSLSTDDTNATLTISDLTISGGLGVDIVCDVTLNYTFHERIPKVNGALMGFTDVRVATGNCSEGDAGLLIGRSRADSGGPHHLTYYSFGGTLPAISFVVYVVRQIWFWFRNGSVECLTEGAQDIVISTTGGNPATGSSVSASRIALDGEFPCDFSTGSMSGSGSLDEAVGISLLG